MKLKKKEGENLNSRFQRATGEKGQITYKRINFRLRAHFTVAIMGMETRRQDNDILKVLKVIDNLELCARTL